MAVALVRLQINRKTYEVGDEVPNDFEGLQEAKDAGLVGSASDAKKVLAAEEASDEAES